MLDQRAITRLPCHRAVRFSWGEKRKGQGVLTDVGLGGARLVAPMKLEMGTMVALSPKQKSAGAAPVAFEVRWCLPAEGKSFQIGLAVRAQMPEFTASWLADLLADQGLRPEQIAQRRRFLRVATDLPARLAAADEEMEPCVIRDLSVGGAGVSSKLLFTPGAAVQLGLPAQSGTPSLMLAGKVVSRRRGQDAWIYGVCFAELKTSQGAALEQLVERLVRTVGA